MPGRPRSFDRDAALECAMRAFWRDGYAGTSVSALTNEIGINPPSLYAAFGDKHGLFEEAAARYVTAFRAGTEKTLELPTAAATVQRMLEVAATAHTDPATPAGCLVFSEPRLADERAWFRTVLAQRIEQGRRDGDVAQDVDAEALSAFVETVITGMSTRAREGSAGRDELTATAHLAMRAFPASPIG